MSAKTTPAINPEAMAEERVRDAAPVMLSALRAIRVNMEADVFIDPIKREMYLAVADAAIAKAEGKA